MTMTPVFDSFFMGGFESTTYRRRDGVRLDLLHSTGHDRHAEQDYRQLIAHGLCTVRDGLRWHLIEASSGQYDWSSFLPMLRAARTTGMQVVWDLCHYGWPDHIDIWSADFPEHFARFAAAAATLVKDETPGIPFYCPVNEISFWAWAGGDMSLFSPATRGRGMELKCQLVRASIAAIQAIRDVDPRARIISVDPVIHVVPKTPRSRKRAEHRRASQFEAWDMITGRVHPELGGSPDCLDILGANYYPHNQWVLRGETIHRGDPRYRPFRDVLIETWERYKRPLFIAETGTEGDQRQAWMRYVCDEVAAVLQRGVPVEGICLYPVTDYHGWDDDRHCKCGLLGMPDANGKRDVYAPLAAELATQQQRFRELLRGGNKTGDEELAYRSETMESVREGDS